MIVLIVINRIMIIIIQIQTYLVMILKKYNINLKVKQEYQLIKQKNLYNIKVLYLIKNNYN